MPDIGQATLDYDLHAVQTAALISVADDAHIARVVGFGERAHL